MNKDLANCLSNASQYIVKAGEDSIKKQLINEIIPLKAAKNHKNRTVHIHDFEFYSISYNCIGISVKSLLGNDLYSFPKALRSLGRQIIALTNLQSGGIGFLDFDNDMADYLNNISDEDAIDNLREFFFDLNSFSRKGCEKPYVTFNIGLSTSENGRRFSKLLLKAYSEGDENGNPLIFPNIVFKLKKDINFMKESPNNDLYLLALSITSKRMVPTYFNCDALENKNADPNKIGIMGCRTRVVSNLYGNESGMNRGNIACVTINLVQLAFESNRDIDVFKKLLEEKMQDSRELLIHRLKYLAKHGDFSNIRAKNLYVGSEKSNFDMLKNGTLSIGFIGLWDAISVLHNKEFSKIDDMIIYKNEAFNIIKKNERNY